MSDAPAWIGVDDRLPPDDTPVLVAVTGGIGWPVLRASYARRFTLEVGVGVEDSAGEYDEKTDTYYCGEGWFEMNCYEETHWRIEGAVTHWMPLPDPPEKTP